jgi:hypothetical protein
VRVAQCRDPHVLELDEALAIAVGKKVALLRVELGRGDDLGELLHVGGLDVEDIEALVRHVQVPQVDAQVIGGDEGFPIRVD